MFGFLQGVAVGSLAAIALFIVKYSRVNVVKHTLSGASFQSRVTRASRLRAILHARGEQTHILQLQGYLFFGTAHRLLEQVRGRFQQTDLPPVRFVVLDFRQMTGLDSTAILSFTQLKQLAQDRAATLILTGLSPAMQAQFASHGLGEAERTMKVFPDLDRGVEWCEAEILRAEGAADEAGSLQQHIEQLLPEARHVETLLQYLKREDVAPNAYLIRQGDAPDVMYLLERGQVTAQLEPASGGSPTRLETMRGGRVVGQIGFYLDLIVHLLAERVTHLIRAVDALLK